MRSYPGPYQFYNNDYRNYSKDTFKCDGLAGGYPRLVVCDKDAKVVYCEFVVNQPINVINQKVKQLGAKTVAEAKAAEAKKKVERIERKNEFKTNKYLKYLGYRRRA